MRTVRGKALKYAKMANDLMDAAKDRDVDFARWCRGRWALRCGTSATRGSAAIGKEMDKVDAERAAAIRDDLANRDRGMRISCNTLEDLKGSSPSSRPCATDTCRWSWTTSTSRNGIARDSSSASR